MLAGVDERPARLHGAGDDTSHVHAFHLQMDLAARDARQIEQIVHQPDELMHLAIDHLVKRLCVRLVGTAQAEQLDSIADRRQGIAQFVGEHGEKFVFVAVGFLDVAIQPGVVQSDGGTGGEILG